MIERMALKLAIQIKKLNPEETSGVRVLRFALIMVIGTGSAIAISLLISSFLGTFIETFVVLIAFMVIRAMSGGFHFRSAEMCTLSSIIGAVTIPYIALALSIEQVWYMTILSALIFGLFAPVGLNQSRYLKPKHYPILKLVSILIIILNLYFSSPLLAVTFFTQGMTLIIYKLKGERG